MIYVIDIDGTICTITSNGNYKEAIPISSRIEEINRLYDEGNQIIYLTARGMGRFKNSRILAYKEFYDLTYTQLISWGCKFHELHLGKPSGDFYIDDKGVNSNNFFTD